LIIALKGSRVEHYVQVFNVAAFTAMTKTNHFQKCAVNQCTKSTYGAKKDKTTNLLSATFQEN